MKIEEIKKYIADDGREFDNEKDCAVYEWGRKNNAEYMLGGIPHHIVVEDSLFPYCGSYVYGYLFIMCRDCEDVKRFKEWIGTHGFESVDVFPHHTLIVEVSFIHEDVATLKNIENVNEVFSLCDYVHKLNKPFFAIENQLENMIENRNI